MPLVGGFTIPGQFSVQFNTFTPDTRCVFSFCRTANRINVVHILTQEEINSIDPETGIGEINVGEYVFDCVCVTDQVEAINVTLSEQDLEEIEGTESESDRAFRKLFENSIPDNRNRLIGVKPNKIGIEFRLDNGSPKAISTLETNGNGNFVGEGAANYRDGTSRILLVNLTKITERLPTAPGSPVPPANSLQGTARVPKAGDVLYLTYVAVTDHYIRYSINTRWSISAISLPPQCFGNPTTVKVAAFRFFDWDVDDENGNPVRVSGWRVVETHNAPVNFVAPMGIPGEAVLGDFIVGGGSQIQNVAFMPANSNIEEISDFADNQALLPTYGINLNQPASGANFHLNAGAEISGRAYLRSDWYNRKNYTTYQSWYDAQSTVYFNVHPEALKKRDVDKFGIERFLCNEILQDIKANKRTFFPFMDDPSADNPTITVSKFLDSTNCKFSPIQPVSRWTVGNAEIDCATGSGVALFPNGQGGFNGTGDVFAVFGIASPIITEKFEIDTRLLVEIFATSGAASGPNTIAIQGVPGGDKSVSCIADRIKQNAFVAHTDSDSRIVFNSFDYGQLSDGLRIMEYRPDIPVTESVNISDHQELLGYSGLLGDLPGYNPGTIISVSKYSDISKFKFKTTSRDFLTDRISSLTDENITEINFSKNDTTLIIPVDNLLNGITEIFYSASPDFKTPILVLFKSGNEIVGSIDSIEINGAYKSVAINHLWMRGDSIEITGNLSGLTVENISVMQLDASVANDFLNEQTPTGDRFDLENLNLYNRSVLFESNVISFGENSRGVLFLFFNDKNNGISCLQSFDDGLTWLFHYGIIESINEISSQNPFVIPVYAQNKCLVFYQYSGKILCKSIPMHMFLESDAFLIESFSDRFVPGDNESLPTEGVGIFSEEGKSLRRGILSYVAAGDLTDVDFLSLTGRNITTGEYQPNEDRNIEYRSDTNVITSEVKNVIKNPIAIGSSTAFVNKDIDTIYFSAYRKTNGITRLFFLSQAKEEIGGGLQLQCNFSSDDGINWYDAWEWAEHRYERFKTDSTNLTSFIDRNSSSPDLEMKNPMESQQLAPFGINLHWSRLRSHKIDAVDSNSDSMVLPIDSPYVFYHNFLHQVFIFYVYNGCLLCKVFDDNVLDPEEGTQIPGMSQIKELIEKNTRSHFIDGDLSSDAIREEIHYFINIPTKERQIEGNIVFRQQYGISQFNSNRTISPQRVCAYKFGNCNVRVFYKIDQSSKLRAATWNGTDWFVEEFLRDEIESNIPEEDLTGITDVTGGFGANKF